MIRQANHTLDLLRCSPAVLHRLPVVLDARISSVVIFSWFSWFVFNHVVLLWGDTRCGSLLGLKGLSEEAKQVLWDFGLQTNCGTCSFPVHLCSSLFQALLSRASSLVALLPRKGLASSSVKISFKPVYTLRLNECKYMKHIFELRMKDQIEERSSQLLRNLSSWEKKAWKKFSLERDSNPWPLRCRCSALPTELSSQLGASASWPNSIRARIVRVFW